jgi:hypothetical protein
MGNISTDDQYKISVAIGAFSLPSVPTHFSAIGWGWDGINGVNRE